MYDALAERLSAECGLAKTDLIISCVENKKEDWSFGMGEAQFLTEKLQSVGLSFDDAGE